MSTYYYDSTATKLRWAPPAQVSPQTIVVPSGFYSGSFATNQDVIFDWTSAGTRFSEFQVTGGRHLRIIGGASTKGAGGSAIQFTGCAGSIFMEGLAIDTSAANIDAINACGDQSGPYVNKPDIYIQNCRIVGVNGSNATVHADAYQAQGAIGNLYVDRVTITSNHQGMSLFQNQFPTGNCFISRMNCSYIVGGDSNTSLMWNMDQATNSPYSPVFVDQVYFAPRAAQNLGDCVYPQPGVTNTAGLAIGMVSSDSFATGRFPPLTNCFGLFRSGAPAGGDWCASAVPGPSYASPGYQSSVPVLAETHTGPVYSGSVGADSIVIGGPANRVELTGSAGTLVATSAITPRVYPNTLVNSTFTAVESVILGSGANRVELTATNGGLITTPAVNGRQADRFFTGRLGVGAHLIIGTGANAVVLSVSGGGLLVNGS